MNAKKKNRLGAVTKMSPREILGGLAVSTVRDAYSRGMSLSGLLERMSPREEGDRSPLDAFGRVLREAEIFVRSDPSVGVVADTWDDAFDPSTGFTEAEIQSRRILGLEWVARQWRKASFGNSMIQQSTGKRDSPVLQSNDYVVGTWERPYSDAQQYRLQQIQPAIPLSELIAVTTPIDSNVYRAVYIEDIDPSQKRMVRVGETADVPRVIFKSAERDIPLYKYGRAIESSYEVMRRQRLDRIAIEIALMAVQVENDKVDTVLDVIVNGDGNSGTAADITALTTLDSTASPTNITLESWIAAKMLFKNPYHARVLLANQGPITKAMMINTGSANIPLTIVANWMGLGGFTVLNQTLSDNVGYGVIDSAPANKWVLFDNRFAIERVYEIGANITEVENFAIRQTRALIMSEVEGYAVLDKRAANVVNLGG
jgi:hypothetical protein